MELVAVILIIGIIKFGPGIWVSICLCLMTLCVSLITLLTIQTLTQLTTLTLPIFSYYYHYLQYKCHSISPPLQCITIHYSAKLFLFIYNAIYIQDHFFLNCDPPRENSE